MPRVVLDTNVVLSALLFGSDRMAWLVNAWQNKLFIPLVSRESVTELLRVLAYPKFQLTTQERDAVLGAFLPYTETITIPKKISAKLPECRDPEDKKFLAVAHAGRADYLVTGDNDLLMLSAFACCPILSPKDFKNILP